MRNQGGGNPVENGVTFVSGSSTSESTDFVITSDEASQSETPLRANAVVVVFSFFFYVLILQSSFSSSSSGYRFFLFSFFSFFVV
ncbi:uncharacterized protein [Physcomitrium patens]|uniref:uncharacterized protein isoform X3 n=1 Tax=Physcomitrium patens TaxID=3218 RepID=UPI003CCD3DC0